MNHWYYAIADSVNGPVATSRLIELIRERSIKPETNIWAQGLSGWISAEDAAEQFGWDFEMPREG